jgi:hypothetical protein
MRRRLLGDLGRILLREGGIALSSYPFRDSESLFFRSGIVYNHE